MTEAARSDAVWLEDPDTAAGLSRGAARGAAATVSAQAWKLLLQLGSTALLARLLSPEDFGLVGMVLAVTALADQLRDMGLANAIVQRRTLDQDHVSALFWINVIVGCLLTLVVVCLSPVLARFYGEPELQWLAVGLSFTYVLSSAGTQHSALLLRRFRYRAVALRDITAQTVGVGAAVAAAAMGAGTWSLVMLYVVAAAVRTIVVWSACSWRPSFPRLRVAGLAQSLAFGAHLSGFGLLNYLSRNADNVLIGKFVGPTALGAYGRAYALLLAPLQQVTQPLANVLVPTLARLQEQPARYSRAYLDGLSVVTLSALPLIVVLAVLGNRVVEVLLGAGWERSGDLFQLLAPAGAAQVITGTCGWLYVSSGAARRMLLWAMWTRPLTLIAFAVGLRWGPEGVAAAYSIVTCAIAVPSMVNATRGTPVGTWAWVPCVGRAAAIAVTAALATAAVVGLTEDSSPVPGLLLPLAAGATVHVGGVLAWPACRAVLLGVMRAVRSEAS